MNTPQPHQPHHHQQQPQYPPPHQMPYPPTGPYSPTPQPPHPTTAVTYSRTRTSHGLHLFLTIITAGAWGLFVWLPLTLWHKYGPRSRATTHYQ